MGVYADQMGNRVFIIRRSLGLNQEKFGDNLGVTKSSISSIEAGKRNLTDTMIKLICSTYGVNEVWLRTGECEMFRENDSSNEEKKLIINGILDTDDPFMLALHKELQKMNQAQLDLLRDMIRSLSEFID